MPPVTDLLAWEAPANTRQVAALVTPLANFYSDGEGASTEALVAALEGTVSALSGSGYTMHEIAWAVRAFWRDPANAWVMAKSRPVNPAMFIPHIEELRRLQASLTTRITEYDLSRLLTRFPSELCRNDFGICGYDTADRPLFMFKRAGVLRTMIAKSKRLTPTLPIQRSSAPVGLAGLLVEYSAANED